MGPDERMNLADFDYDLPEGAIAQEPAEPRDAARLLVDRGPGAAPEHRRVRDLAAHVRPGDVVVVNETRVLPARLRLRKATGGAVEVLLLAPTGRAGEWAALVRPSRRVAPGTDLTVGAGAVADAGGVADLVVTVGERLDGGRRRVTVRRGCRPVGLADADEALAGVGEVPLPPYIDRPLADAERYQTVFATVPGSVAAPTAGLHLTDDVLAGVTAAGAEVVRCELVVGLDTFRPVTVDDPADHVMHSETYRVPSTTWQAVEAADRVVAVGTTTVRALESVAAGHGLSGSTDLFIRRPYEFGAVDVLLTNFHLPRSTLLLMIDAFVGPRWRELYTAALAAGYRFLSFGDAMLLTRTAP